ncbi:MAG: DUF4399 domain-containing protein [Nitrospina sp.]|nr:DUF4399 domain-containing protein [Nitrospina sp.]
MKKISIEWLVLAAVCLIFSASTVYADSEYGSIDVAPAVVITEPATGATVSSPVKVCMGVNGVVVQPAKKGINPGSGHHHLLIDVDLPSNLSKGIGKDANHVHMGDGSTCKELKLDSGRHIIRTLFANGGHVPYNPALTSTVIVTVK